jgi:hypothetical protein
MEYAMEHKHAAVEHTEHATQKYQQKKHATTKTIIATDRQTKDSTN